MEPWHSICSSASSATQRIACLLPSGSFSRPLKSTAADSHHRPSRQAGSTRTDGLPTANHASSSAGMEEAPWVFQDCEACMETPGGVAVMRMPAFSGDDSCETLGEVTGTAGKEVVMGGAGDTMCALQLCTIAAGAAEVVTILDE